MQTSMKYPFGEAEVSFENCINTKKLKGLLASIILATISEETMSSLRCRFFQCIWTGTEEDIFHHLELYHKPYLREPNGWQFYDFLLSDLQKPTYVLASSEGLYWFSRNPLTHTFSNVIVFGIFHIGNSKRMEYTLKLGLRRDQDCQYWGPFKTQSELVDCNQTKEVYELGFHFHVLEDLYKNMKSQKLRLYFGDFDDSDDVPWPLQNDWDQMNLDDRLSSICWKHLVCCSCAVFIRRDARFCENNHYLCLDCFDGLLKQKNLKCPLCKGLFKYDCSDDELECWLRLLKWP